MTRLSGLLERGRGDDVRGEIRLVRQRVRLAKLLRHLAPTSTASALPEVDENPELVVHLRAARDEDERTLDVAEKPAEHVELALEEEAGIRGQEVGDTLGRRMRPVSRAERVVHVQIHGEALGGLGIVRVSPGSKRVFSSTSMRSSGTSSESRGYGCDRERLISALRAAEMRAHGDVRSAASEQIPQRRQRRSNPCVVRDPPVLERHVQVGANEDALPRDVGVTNRARALHRLPGRASIRSTSRHE